MKEELLEAMISDVKKMITENPNDMDLGGKVRAYFLEFKTIADDFQKVISNFKEDDNTQE
jgi:hypothetical protein